MQNKLWRVSTRGVDNEVSFYRMNYTHKYRLNLKRQITLSKLFDHNDSVICRYNWITNKTSFYRK